MKRKMTLLLALLATLAISGQIYIHQSPAFRSFYDTRLQIPVQVDWVLQPNDMGRTKREPSWRFTPDLPASIMTASHKDYNRSGYDRGHMCPAADRSGSKSKMKSTFVLSNVCPQTPALNRGAWKITEDSCRKLAMLYDSIMIVACPVFLPADTVRIGTARIGVPHAFFKACWVAGSDSVISCWFMFNR